RGFDGVPCLQVKIPVRSATHFKPAQHGAWFAPQLVPSIAEHAQDGATKSPWARCAGTEASPTVIRCAFAGLPGGTWQMLALVAAATWGMRAIAANTKNAAHIVRVFGSGSRGFIVMSGPPWRSSGYSRGRFGSAIRGSNLSAAPWCWRHTLNRRAPTAGRAGASPAMPARRSNRRARHWSSTPVSSPRLPLVRETHALAFSRGAGSTSGFPIPRRAQSAPQTGCRLVRENGKLPSADAIVRPNGGAR